MHVNSEEAARALAAVEASRAAFRSALRANRGHLHLWLWGSIWSTMALLMEFLGNDGVRHFPWLCFGGGLASLVIGRVQASQIRVPLDRRFLAVLFSVLGFALLWPLLLLRQPPPNELVFVYVGLVTMQAYVIAGIWFDTYLFWLGLLVTVLLLAGWWLLAPWFWIWVAVCCGGTLIASGFYVRYLMP